MSIIVEQDKGTRGNTRLCSERVSNCALERVLGGVCIILLMLRERALWFSFFFFFSFFSLAIFHSVRTTVLRCSSNDVYRDGCLVYYRFDLLSKG